MNRSDCRPVVTAGLLLGMGLGGFVDGIVFHQLLQTHNMLSARYPKTGVESGTAVRNIEINMFWDGIFHAAVWVMTVVGLALLWRAVRRPDAALVTRCLVGAMALGWGAFNLVEGVIDHHLLHLHHVVEAHGVSMFDWAFLGSGIVLCVGGFWAVKSGANLAASRPAIP